MECLARKQADTRIWDSSQTIDVPYMGINIGCLDKLRALIYISYVVKTTDEGINYRGLNYPICCTWLSNHVVPVHTQTLDKPI